MDEIGDHTKNSEAHGDHHSEGTGVGYEQSDVKIGVIIRFGIGLAVGTAVVLLLMWGLFKYFEARETEQEQALVPATRIATDQPRRPSGPVLQGAPGSKFELKDPVEEMEEWLRTEDEQLNKAGWVDENAGTVRIPINRAKELLLERGLPVRGRAITPEQEVSALVKAVHGMSFNQETAPAGPSASGKTGQGQSSEVKR
ncbi:MAG: hypothetical protein L0229_16910 [Blastocatellia bacterium]|nr:hypothetical protein [Blastocatellia bacterium]